MRVNKKSLIEISIFAIIFVVSILYILLIEFLNIPRPYFLYENFMVIPITYIFGATIGAVFLFFIISLDVINYIGSIYFHNSVDIYKNLQFFFSHSYVWFYYFFQIIVIFLCYFFYRLVRKIKKHRLRNISLFLLSILLITFSVDHFLLKQERFKNLMQTNDITVTGIKNISSSLIFNIYSDVQEYIGANSNLPYIKLPDSKIFFYPTLESYKSEVSKVKKNVVLVILESFGYVNDPDVKEYLLESLNDVKLNKKFHINSFKLEAEKGSTVTAEFRELCGVKYNNYNKIHKDLLCAPKIFEGLGYTTLAAHPYIGGYFNRKVWWKEIGFEETYFMNSINNKDLKKCYGTYKSYCDNEYFSRMLKKAISIKKPFFLYYLSVEGHLPTKIVSEDDYLDCISKVKRNRLFCGNLLINKSLIETIMQEIIDLELEDTDFYLIGDHVPVSLLSQNSYINKANNLQALQAISLISKTRE